MSDKVNLEFDDNDREARAIKPGLRFVIGSVVYIVSDLDKKRPMTVISYLLDDNYADYSLRWLNSQGCPEYDALPDKTLMQ